MIEISHDKDNNEVYLQNRKIDNSEEILESQNFIHKLKLENKELKSSILALNKELQTLSKEKDKVYEEMKSYKSNQQEINQEFRLYSNGF